MLFEYYAVPGSPSNVTACTTGTHSVLVSWIKPESVLYLGSPQNIKFFICVNDALAAVTDNTSIELNSSQNITADTNYLINVGALTYTSSIIQQ